jgi:hypothetical protein
LADEAEFPTRRRRWRIALSSAFETVACATKRQLTTRAEGAGAGAEAQDRAFKNSSSAAAPVAPSPASFPTFARF